jgi:hypothetical protein
MSAFPLSIAVLLVAGPTAPKPPPAVYPVDTQCAAAAKLGDAHKQDARFYADLSDAVRPGANDGSGKWRSFKNADELKAYVAKQRAPNTQASIWKAPDGTTIAFMHFTNASADWSDDVEYCFRPDGTLARAVAALMNLSEEVYGHRTMWFGADGVLLHTKEKASESGARRKPGPNLMADLHDTIVYPGVTSLPFLAPPGAASTKPVPAAPAKRP